MKDVNTSVLKELSSFNTYEITRQFDGWGTSAGRTWYLNGQELDEDELIGWIKDLKESADSLLKQIMNTSEYVFEADYSITTVYTYETLSDIGQAIINNTNNFLSKTEEVFKGTGLRSGKNDGIVNSITEVLEVESKNVQELKTQILNVAEMAQGLGKNYDNMEEYLSKNIEEGILSGKYEVMNIPETYTAYLEENNILDDVKDVLEAYDLQVEEASQKLANSIVSGFEDLYREIYIKLVNIYDAIFTFSKCVNELKSRINKTVTSKEFRTTIYNHVISDTEEVSSYSHGKLGDLFPRTVVRGIEYSTMYIIPLLEPIFDAKCFLDSYHLIIGSLKEHFSSIIEKGVYNSMELTSIIESQNLISSMIQRMKSEIEQVSKNLGAQFEGQSIEAYITHLESMIKSLEYFNLMINDCFGTNLESSES